MKRALVKGYAFCIWIIILLSLDVTLITWAIVDICLRESRCQHKLTRVIQIRDSLSPGNKVALFSLWLSDVDWWKIIVSWGWFPTAECVFDPAFERILTNHVGLLTEEGWAILALNLQLVYSLTNKNSRK